MPQKNIEAEGWIDLGNHLAALELISINLGPGGELYALALEGTMDYRESDPGGFSFPKVRASHPQNFHIFRYDGKDISRYLVKDQTWNYHHVQPLPDDELLLVCSRSYYRDISDFDLNGRVFDLAGNFKREFLLGDGINSVQTTNDGYIWTSYSDEGIFGNFGWGQPVGMSGLIEWDRFGKQVYAYTSPPGIGLIADCYALNVASNQETWLCYYTDFPLVYLKDREVADFWNCPIPGADGFAVWKGRALFRGGYQEHDLYHLAVLEHDHQMEISSSFYVRDEHGETIAADRIAVRGSAIVVVRKGICYRLDLLDL